MKKFAAILAAILVSSCMVVSVSAADFTPSVEGKDAPTVTVQADEQGNEYVAVVYDADGNVVQGVSTGGLVVTPVSKMDEASADVSVRLNEAYEQIKNAATLTDLTPEVETVLAQMPIEVAAENMVVRDLFDVSFDAETEDLLAEGNRVTLTFEVAIEEGKPMIVLQYVDGVWKVIDPSFVIINADGTVTVTLSSAGTVAFATQKDTTAGGENAVAYLFQNNGQNDVRYTVSASETSASSSNSSSQLPYLIGAGAAVIVAATAASALLIKKDK